MAYTRSRWRGYSSRSGTNWADWHSERRDKVSNSFGGIDAEVSAAFFNLQPAKLEAVLNNYGKRYGRGPQRYAQQAYPKWREGKVEMSGQTMERLLEIVPPFLSFDTKLSLYRTVRDRYRPNDTTVATVRVADDLAGVSDVVSRIVDRARSQPLPAHVDARLGWLSHGDGLLTRRIIAEAEIAEGEITANKLQRELEVVLSLLQEPGLRVSAEHSIQLPCGTVVVRFAKPKKRSWINAFWRRR